MRIFLSVQFPAIHSLMKPLEETPPARRTLSVSAIRQVSAIKADIDALVDLKREILETIKSLHNVEFQTILERRYLCFETWEKIAADMGYDLRWLFRLHGKALEEAQTILDNKSR